MLSLCSSMNLHEASAQSLSTPATSLLFDLTLDRVRKVENNHESATSFVGFDFGARRNPLRTRPRGLSLRRLHYSEAVSQFC
jgi:hypothetical protein